MNGRANQSISGMRGSRERQGALALMPSAHGAGHRASLPARRAAAALVVLLGLSAAALTGCAEADDTSVTAPVASSSTAGFGTAGTSTGPPVTYRSVDALCPALDFRPLSELFGPVGQQQHQSRPVGATTNLTCTATLGQLPRGVVVTVAATIGAPEAGRVMYEGLRRVHDEAESVRDLASLGAGAYAYTDVAGSHIVTYDANLYLTLTAAPLRLNATPDPALVEPMSRVAASALSALRA